MKRYQVGLLATGLLFVVGWAGHTLAATAEFDDTVVYVCDHCDSGESARQFLEQHILYQPCDSDGGDPRFGTGACVAPDIRAVVLNPSTLELRSFLLKRRSMARENLPPMVSSQPNLISPSEQGEIIQAWDKLARFDQMMEAIGSEMTEWVSDYFEQESDGDHSDGGDAQEPPLGGGGNDFIVHSSADEELICPTGTALSLVGDRDALHETKNTARERVIEAYDAHFQDGTLLDYADRASVGVSSPYLTAGVEFDLTRSEQFFGYYEIEFNNVEVDGGWERLSNPDYLVFDVYMYKSNLGTRASVGFNSSLSVVHGEKGFLDLDTQIDPEDECTEAHLIGYWSQTTTPGGPGNSGVGGGGGGGIGGGGGPGAGVPGAWICHQGFCCHTGSKRCTTEDDIN